MFARHSSTPTCAAKTKPMLEHLYHCPVASQEVREWAHGELINLMNVHDDSNHSILDTIPCTPLIVDSNLPSHIEKYLKISHSARSVAGPSLLDSHSSSSQSLQHASSSLAFYSKDHSYISPFSTPVQREFENDLCKLFTANDWSWTGADNIWFNWFREKWIPGSRKVSAKSLSGPILDRQIVEVENRLGLLAGRLGTGQSDGWKNIARTNIVGTLVSVNADVRPINVEHRIKLTSVSSHI